MLWRSQFYKKFQAHLVRSWGFLFNFYPLVLHILLQSRVQLKLSLVIFKCSNNQVSCMSMFVATLSSYLHVLAISYYILAKLICGLKAKLSYLSLRDHVGLCQWHSPKVLHFVVAVRSTKFYCHWNKSMINIWVSVVISIIQFLLRIRLEIRYKARH